MDLISPRKKMATKVYPRFGTTAKNPGAKAVVKGKFPKLTNRSQTSGHKATY